MLHVLAAEGGYQEFQLHGGEWLILIASAITALIAIGVGFILMSDVLKQDQGTPKMIEIATAIQEGALAYLKRQFRTIAVILVPLAVVVFLTSVKVVKPDGDVALSFGAVRRWSARWPSSLGCVMSGLTGFIGMTPGHAGQRAHRGRGQDGLDAGGAARWPSAPAAWPACSPSASACSAPPSSS